MKIHDISMLISEDMAVYKNNQQKRPKIKTSKDFSNSDVYESSITLDLHTGTHIDMPFHMMESGNKIPELDLSRCVNKCKVIDLTTVKDKITRNELINKGIVTEDFVLFKTRNSYTEEFDKNFVYLEKTGAYFLSEINVLGVGIDSLGIERNQPSHYSHKILLQKNIVVLEGLRLKEINEGEYFLFAVPLNIKDVEGAPTRAILVEGLSFK